MSMTDVTLLGGKVIKRCLQVFREPPPADAPAVKRLLLPYGELAQFYDGDAGMRYIAFVELRAGGTRGNHYHKVKEEIFYIVSGQVLMKLCEVETGEKSAVVLSAGELAVIPPGVAHAFQTKEAGQAVEFSPNRFNPTDSYRLEL
jgi:mannose-6-phosphate isomerase-like protein (cupin superfamily)